MKSRIATPQNFLWLLSSTPLPDFGRPHRGFALTPFGFLHLTWTDNFLLEAGFDSLPPNEKPSAHAQKLADLIVAESPLPIRPAAIGTAFQLRVWQALIHIPHGSTSSYQAIAHTIGSPNAARAVGSAVGANRLALLIPCHRVIRRNGDIGGFGWGIPTKHSILSHEQSHP